MRYLCARCGSEFHAKPSRKQRFCSLRCSLIGNHHASESLEERFWTHVERGPENACWPWRGNRNHSGYGVVAVTKSKGLRRQVMAHRIAYELTHGKIPNAYRILHSCDNPPCVNPTHLRVGTDADNVADMHARGRYRGGFNKLTRDQVMVIKSLLSSGHRQRDIAERFGVDPSSVSNIARGKVWRSA